MSASESESPKPPAAADPPFVERDDRETQLPFGHGRVPIYIAIAWVLFIICYVTGMSLLALPDLRAWISR